MERCMHHQHLSVNVVSLSLLMSFSLSSISRCWWLAILMWLSLLLPGDCQAVRCKASVFRNRVGGCHPKAWLSGNCISCCLAATPRLAHGWNSNHSVCKGARTKERQTWVMDLAAIGQNRSTRCYEKHQTRLKGSPHFFLGDKRQAVLQWFFFCFHCGNRQESVNCLSSRKGALVTNEQLLHPQIPCNF